MNRGAVIVGPFNFTKSLSANVFDDSNVATKFLFGVMDYNFHKIFK